MLQDKRVLGAVEPLISPKELNKQMIKKENYRDIDSILPGQCSVKESYQQEYIDFIEYPMPFVSDELKELLIKYDERLITKPVVFQDIKKQKQTVYWLIAPKFVNCLSLKSKFKKDQSIDTLIIDEKKIEYCPLFRIDGIYENYIIVRLDLAESILRRDFTGIKFKKIEKEVHL